jgi:50S ribosomal protein L16 3-hydroxylase
MRNDRPSRLLGGLTERQFLQRHWQKEPLLVRGAIEGFVSPISPQELAGLACEPDSTSRLISMPREGANWDVRVGPFATADFESLPNRGWTLLVQEVDRWIEGCAELLDRFRFIPNWRIDDVMVSYATDRAGVGPHIDRYDVFLLQGLGQRRWRIASTPELEERLVPEVEHRILADFEPDREWLLEPGDVLYLPPRIAHDGSAVGECMTFSIGFRAPDPRELCASFLTQLSNDAFDAIRYADPDLDPPVNIGEIPPAARERLRASAARLFEEGHEFDRWVGRFVTTPRRDHRPGGADRACRRDELVGLLRRGESLERSAVPHFCWYREADGTVQLFAGGERYDLDPGWEPVAELLCGRERLDGQSLQPYLDRDDLIGVLIDLMLRGYLVASGDA